MLVLLRSAVFFAVAISFLGTPPVSGKAIEDRDWIEVRTENFRVRSNMREKEAIELIRYLELFRAAVSVITNVRSTESPIPTDIYALRGSNDFSVLGLDRMIAGLFIPGQRSNIMLIRDARGMKETATILHEYVHFLVRNHGHLIYPKWFDEGFAEYLSATRLTRKHFEVGVFPEERKPALIYLTWIPIRRIISAENYNEWRDETKAMFYAESWALVNYLQNRPDNKTSFGQELAEYIKLTESGETDVAAFEQAFGMTMNQINRKVKSHLQRGRFMHFTMKPEKLLPAFEPVVVDLSREQVSLHLAQVAFSMGKLDQAEGWLRIAATGEETRARAEAGLGDVLKFRGEFEDARPHFEKAVALAPDDPYCQLDLAEYWHTLAATTEDTDKRAEYISSARAHYVKAWKLDDSLPETFAQYGRTYLLEGQDFDRAIEMLEEAEYLLPSEIGIRIALAEAYAGAGRNEDAVKLARSVLVWSHYDSDLVKWAEELAAPLESNEDQAEEVDDVTATTVP